MTAVGLIARGGNTGLGLQTWGFQRHLQPAKTVIVDLGPREPYELHPERFPGATIVAVDEANRWPIGAIHDFLDGLDVVLTAETPYDYVLLDLARARGVRTVVQANWEFFRWTAEPDLPRPDLWLAPSTWMLDQWPEPTVHLPFPVDRPEHPFTLRTEARTFLHVAGHRTRQDRNGTRAFIDSLRLLRRECSVVVHTQDPLPATLYRGRYAARSVDVQVHRGDTPDSTSLYETGDVLVMPRKFGGQSLVVNEALSRGMPVLMPDIAPQSAELPVGMLFPVLSGEGHFQSGPVTVAHPRPPAIAEAMHRLHDDPAEVERLSKEADRLAEERSWETLLPRYLDVLNGRAG